MYDYHNHTSFSHDSRADIRDVIKAGIAAGLKEIAITDHYDPQYSNPDRDVSIKLDQYRRVLGDVKAEYKDSIKVVRGIELGLQLKSLHETSKEVRCHDYDFVLGSFHCAENMDIFGDEFYSGRSLEEAYRGFYDYVYSCISQFTDYDILGHLNIVERYSGKSPAAESYMDIVEMILKRVIDDGKGIEFNTSCFRYGLQNSTPSDQMLRLYRNLGGHIITVGSDAHIPQDVGHMIPSVYCTLKSLGFENVATYSDRKLKLVSI